MFSKEASDNDKIPRIDPRVDMAFARSSAVADYSNLEQALCRLFAGLTGLEPGVAALIFYSIVSSRSRDAILRALLGRKVEDAFQPFWRQFLGHANDLSGTRNKIVHWAQEHEVTRTEFTLGEAPDDVSLCPPNIWWHDETTPRISRDDLREFSKKADIVARGISMFTHILVDPQPHTPEHVRTTWLETFQQPFPYPLPEGHPLARSQ